jgi:hypothetical protein
MVSLCLGHTWDHKHHGLFPPIPYMRPGTTRSVYNSMVSETMMLYRQRVGERSMVSCMELVWRDHDVAYTEVWTYVWNWWEETMMLHRLRVVPVLMHRIGVKRPWCCIEREWSLVHTWDHRPLCIYNIMVFSHQFQTIEHSVYTTSWSLLTNSIHETIDHSLYIQHHVVERDHGVYGLMYGPGIKRPWCCRQIE